MPIGLTPGFLFSGIRRHATKAITISGWTLLVHRRQATAARALHRSLEAFLNEEHSRRQAYTSTPEGPAAPWVWRAACLMLSPVIISKIMASWWCSDSGGLE